MRIVDVWEREHEGEKVGLAKYKQRSGMHVALARSSFKLTYRKCAVLLPASRDLQYLYCCDTTVLSCSLSRRRVSNVLE